MLKWHEKLVKRMRKSARKSLRAIMGDRLFAYVSYLKPECTYLRKVRGVLHVGANVGQERFVYDAFGLNVVWVEPIPSVFQTLASNVAQFPNQRALNYLVTAEDGKEYQFNIATNEGRSSSILDLAKHKEMFPEISYTSAITLTGSTLESIVKREKIDLSKHEALILDTQGSEFQILGSSSNILRQFKFIAVEAADFEAYDNCGQIETMSAFMQAHGFREHRREVQNYKDGLGTYYDVTYRRDDSLPVMPIEEHKYDSSTIVA
jgi:FkbM family methyltransferase